MLSALTRRKKSYNRNLKSRFALGMKHADIIMMKRPKMKWFSSLYILVTLGEMQIFFHILYILIYTKKVFYYIEKLNEQRFSYSIFNQYVVIISLVVYFCGISCTKTIRLENSYPLTGSSFQLRVTINPNFIIHQNLRAYNADTEQNLKPIPFLSSRSRSNICRTKCFKRFYLKMKEYFSDIFI